MNHVRVKGVTTYHIIGGRVLSADSNSMLVELKGKTYEVIPDAGAEHKAWLLAGEKKTFAKNTDRRGCGRGCNQRILQQPNRHEGGQILRCSG
jgi:hypothetical protein